LVGGGTVEPPPQKKIKKIKIKNIDLSKISNIIKILPITVFPHAGLLSMKIPKKALIPIMRSMKKAMPITARRSWI
jgi:hypothetical protein